MKTYKIEITPKSVLIVVFTAILLFLFWQLRFIAFMFFMAFIISAGLRPLVEALHRMGVPRLISIIIIYAILLFVLGLIFYVSGVVIFGQVQQLAAHASDIITDVLSKLFVTFPWLQDFFGITDVTVINFQVQQFLDTNLRQFLVGSVLTESTGQAIINAISNIISVLFGLFTIIVLSAYMLQREDKFYDGVLQLIKQEDRERFQATIDKVESKLGNWLIAQIILMLAVGLTTYLGLLIPGIFFPDNVFTQYAIPLALIAGLLEALPSVGPILTWILALIITIGSGGSVVEVSYIAVLFTAIQQLEAILLVPVVMKKAIGIDPIIVILGILAASSLFGIIGAVLILPLIATAQIFIEEVIKTKPSEE